MKKKIKINKNNKGTSKQKTNSLPQVSQKTKNIFMVILFLFALLAPAIMFHEQIASMVDTGVSYVGRTFVTLNITGGNPPVFDHNLTNQTADQGTAFTYDVNCSDADPSDTITYYDNASFFDIDSSTGVFTWTPNATYLGLNSILITCGAGGINISNNIHITVNDVNISPVLASIGDQTATEGTLFSLNLEATDGDGDTLTFSSNATLFTVNASNGNINFTPTLAQVGTYTINFSVTDGLFNDSEVITLTIFRAPYCGDGGCAGVEDCSTCEADCGVCPSGDGGTGTGTGTGTGGTGGTGAKIAASGACLERWSCTRWNDCSLTGIQSRKCRDLNKCGSTKRKPDESAQCEYQPTCYDGVQNGIEEGVDCGANCKVCPPPGLSCFDGIQNQEEEDIDCGGPCEPCVEVRFARLPTFERAQIFDYFKKQFPWLLILIMVILLIVILSSDQVYVNYIKRSEFAAFRAKYRRYKPFRLKLYQFFVHAVAITIVSSIYLYLVSEDISILFKYLWILMLLLIFIPFIITYIFAQMEYKEHRRRKKEEKMIQMHKLQQWNLITIEDGSLAELEALFMKKIKAIDPESLKQEDLKKELSTMLQLIGALREQRDTKTIPFKIDKDTLADIRGLSVENELVALAKEYPEFNDALVSLKQLARKKDQKKKGKKTALDQEALLVTADDYLTDIEDIARDNHLIAICQSDLTLTDLYNKLVDTYKKIKIYFDNQEELNKLLFQQEQKLINQVEQLSGSTDTLALIEKEQRLVEAYNLLIDLFNHYKKRGELMQEGGT